jgi:hypothetical protein
MGGSGGLEGFVAIIGERGGEGGGVEQQGNRGWW